MRKLEVRFGESEVEFRSYPFPAATVHPAGVIPVDAIDEVLPDAAPPEIRTVEKEVLFVPATEKDALLKFADRNGLSVVSRIDVWSLILQPFVDTEVADRELKRIDDVLEKNGVSPKECVQLRTRVSRAMTAYNVDSGLWDWVHLGLMDLFYALMGELSGEAYRLPEDDFESFYWLAMEIAFRARLV